MKDQFEYEGGAVAYSVKGKGFPVIFLHGFCEDSTIWDDFITGMTDGGHRVICIDLPGFGRSEITEKGCSIEEMGRAVLAVTQRLELKKFVLIGHSLGGYVALAVAAQAGDRLAGLGLFHSHPYPDTDQKKAGRDKGISFIRQHGHPLFVKQLIPTLFAPEFAAGNGFLVDKMVFKAAQYREWGILNALAAMRDRPDRSDVLSGIACPVLFILGEKDQVIPREIDHLQTTLPQTAVVHTLPKAGHMGMLEAQNATRKFCLEFVEYCRQKTD